MLQCFASEVLSLLHNVQVSHIFHPLLSTTLSCVSNFCSLSYHVVNSGCAGLTLMVFRHSELLGKQTDWVAALRLLVHLCQEMPE